MQNLSGSVEQISKGQLTPFELAEYNVAQFAANAVINHQLNELLERIRFLEDLKCLTQKAQSDNHSKQDKKNISTVEEELASSELELQIFCDIYVPSSEA